MYCEDYSIKFLIKLPKRKQLFNKKETEIFGLYIFSCEFSQIKSDNICSSIFQTTLRQNTSRTLARIGPL